MEERKVERIDYPDGGYGLFTERGDKRDGQWQVFFKTGQLKIDRNFVNNREHGITRVWNEKGQLIEEREYYHGELHGIWKKWDDDGNIIHDSEFEFGDSVTSNISLTGEYELLLDSLRKISPEDAALKHDDLIDKLSLYSSTIVEESNNCNFDEISSYIGIVTHLGKGEEWPLADGELMVPLLQVKVDELFVVPKSLEGIALLTIFGPHEFPLVDGQDELEIRLYSEFSELERYNTPMNSLRRKPSKIAFKKVLEFPSKNDLAPGLKIHLEDSGIQSPIVDNETQMETKIGGWPAWLQFSRFYGQGEFGIQIDSCDFEEWDAGDATLFYLFRNSKGEWSSISEMC